MEKIKYNENQVTELNNNKYVKNCIWKHIVFTRECKIKALELSKGYALPREVFKTLLISKICFTFRYSKKFTFQMEEKYDYKLSNWRKKVKKT